MEKFWYTSEFKKPIPRNWTTEFWIDPQFFSKHWSLHTFTNSSSTVHSYAVLYTFFSSQSECKVSSPEVSFDVKVINRVGLWSEKKSVFECLYIIRTL